MKAMLKLAALVILSSCAATPRPGEEVQDHTKCSTEAIAYLQSLAQCTPGEFAASWDLGSHPWAYPDLAARFDRLADKVHVYESHPSPPPTQFGLHIQALSLPKGLPTLNSDLAEVRAGQISKRFDLGNRTITMILKRHRQRWLVYDVRSDWIDNHRQPVTKQLANHIDWVVEHRF